MAKLMKTSSLCSTSTSTVTLKGNSASTTTKPTIDHAELPERFALAVFLLGQFNVHYLSWIKNPTHLVQYWQRFTPFFELLHKLPEFTGLSEPLSEPSKWVICQAIKGAMLYRRKLFIQISKLNGVRYLATNKKFRVMLVENEPGEADSDEESEDEDLVKPVKDDKGRTILGELELKEGVKKWFLLPQYFNRLKSDVQIHLVLVESEESRDDDSPSPEYHQITVSEADISGYKGYYKQEQFEVDDDSSPVPILLDLTLKWQIDLHCFEMLVPEPVTILHKLPGAVFHLGMYYWHFCRDFYRWAATESLDQDTRYCAMQVFHELSMCLPVPFQADDMSSIFLAMYRGRYPTPDQLTVLRSEEDYVSEPVSILENIIFVFQHLTAQEQTAFLNRLRPFTASLLKSRFYFVKRLLALAAIDLGNFEPEQIEDVVLPVTIEALYVLATVRSPKNELADPCGRHLDWKSVQSLASQLTRLAVDCVQHAKPIDWQVVPIEHCNMAPVRRCLALLMRSLFNRTSIRFLQSIYLAMMDHHVLTDQHLASYLTKARLELVRQWCATDDLDEGE